MQLPMLRRTPLSSTRVTTSLSPKASGLAGKYSEATRGVLIDNGTRKAPVLYVSNTNEIVVSAGGKSGKFARAK